MKLRGHVVLLLLAAAYLLMPPPEAVRNRFQIDFSAPLSRWVELRRFNSVTGCERARETYRRKPAGGLPAMLESRPQAEAAMCAAKCISIHDPRLHGQ